MKHVARFARRTVTALALLVAFRKWSPSPSRFPIRVAVLLAVVLTAGGMIGPAPNVSASSGLLTSQTSGNRDQRLVVGTNQDGRQQLFTVGADSQLYTSYQTVINGGFSSWVPLGGSWSSQDSIGVGQNQDGRLQLFMVGTDDLVYTTYQTAINAGFHQPWVPLLGRTFDSQDRIGVGRNLDGRLQVFIVGTDNALYTSYETVANGGFSSWAPLGGSFSSQASIGVGQNQDGRLQLFMVGTDSVLKTSYQTPLPNGGFSSWVSLDASRMWSSQDSIAVGQNQNGRLQISLIGTDGNFYTSYQTAVNGGFSPWGLVPAPVCQGPPQCPFGFTGAQTFPSNDSVAIANTQDGRIALFANASDGQTWTTFQDAVDGGLEPPTGGNGGFTFWQNLACNAFAPGPIAAGSNQDGRIQVYGFGGNNVVLTTYESGANNEGFSCPVSLGQPPLISNPLVTGVSPNMGPDAGGTRIIIFGANFSTTPGQTTFTVGGSPATGVVCTSQTSCTATTPSGAGTVDIIATVNGQVSSPNPPADQFTYDSCGMASAATTITGMPPGSGVDTQALTQLTKEFVVSFAGPSSIPASSYVAVVSWGDGTTSQGTVVPGQTACAIEGDHKYLQPGHYATSVTVAAGPLNADLAGIAFGVSPPSASAPAAVGVLTSDSGPQCTATVVDLANSFDLARPGLDRAIHAIVTALQGKFNNNVVVTAAHCVVGQTGLMFAPGFKGIAPRFSADFTSGMVSSITSGQYGSPFGGYRVGQSPYGVWGCSSQSTRHCGPLGIGNADVIVPSQYSSNGDNSYDYAFVVFKTAPQNQSSSLLQVTGGLPVSFDEPVQTGDLLQSFGYDIDWTDANKPGDTSGWFDLSGGRPENAGNCNGYLNDPNQQKSCHYTYQPFGFSAGPRTCTPSVDEFHNLSILGPSGAESRTSLLASLCDLGDFASGAPYVIGAGHVLLGVEHGVIHIGPVLDPNAPLNNMGTPECCTSVITPLRFPDALQKALQAELDLPN